MERTEVLDMMGDPQALRDEETPMTRCSPRRSSASTSHSASSAIC